MHYDNVVSGKFVARPNRFVAQVAINNRIETVHVKNTGRCKELLVPGATVYLQSFDTTKRKTKYDLIAVEKGTLLINMDSQAPNKVVQEWLLREQPFGEITYIKPEYSYGKSRFDFYLELGQRKMFVEVKGVTLEDQGIVLFPDAPTERGLKHVEELTECLKDGFEAVVLFVIQMSEAKCFSPNGKTQPQFAEAVKRAQEAGVKIIAYTCQVTANTLSIFQTVPIQL